MSTTDEIGNEGTVGGQTRERDEIRLAVVDEVAERERNLQPSVEQEIQATVDYADEWELDGRLFGQTLEEEERLAAFEWEVERTRVRWDRRRDSDRETRSREAARQVSLERWVEFGRLAASVDPWQDPERPDPREELTRSELGAVNRESIRIAEKLEGWSSAAVSRLVAERVVDGADVCNGVLTVYEELETAPGQVVTIGKVEVVRGKEVSVQGTVTTLWKPSHPKIAQVGLLGDETGRIKFTSWKRSGQPVVREGEVVRIHDAARSWYRGRCSIALTARSRMEVLG